ncbi:MAG: beta-galactosidase, partial [bacterium]
MTKTIVILWDKTMPAGFGRPLTQRVWRTAAQGMSVRFANPSDLTHLLDKADLFVNPYGSAFPVESWPAILAYLESGGNFLNWGGVPFRTPVAGNPVGWHTQRSCVNYHRKIGIIQSYTYSPNEDSTVVSCHPRLDKIAKENPLVCPDTYPLTIDNNSKGTDEVGHVNTRDLEYRALLHAIQGGVAVAAPITQMDRLHSPSGGRWIFVTMNIGQLDDKQLDDWVGLLPTLLNMAVEGATAFEVLPTFAGYLPGEKPSLCVSVRSGLGRDPGLSVRLSIRPPKGRIHSVTRKIDSKSGEAGRFEIPLGLTCQPGYYAVQATLRRGGKTIEQAISGFWGYDELLLSRGKPLTADADMIRRGGQAYPLIGSSYGASHPHGKFLRWANPGVWDRDFTEMTVAGIRMVCTGLWGGGPQHLMPEPGVWREDMLRTLDAFLMTAQWYEIPVLFTFFSSTPPCYGGENPYLDPQSLAAQEEFVRTLVKRYKDCPGLIWDLIDKPAAIRPKGDRWELRAWREWLRKHHGDVNSLREAWNVCSDEVLSLETAPLPSEKDFDSHQGFLGNQRPLRVLDYVSFFNEVFADWVRHLRSACRSTGSKQLIAVEQGERSCSSRFSFLHRKETVDFTSVQTHWQSSSPLWERLAARVPDIPNVAKDTESMYIESLDGEPWRTEDECAALLERKYLY